jgi:hypothetical protein
VQRSPRTLCHKKSRLPRHPQGDWGVSDFSRITATFKHRSIIFWIDSHIYSHPRACPLHTPPPNPRVQLFAGGRGERIKIKNCAAGPATAPARKRSKKRPPAPARALAAPKKQWAAKRVWPRTVAGASCHTTSPKVLNDSGASTRRQPLPCRRRDGRRLASTSGCRSRGSAPPAGGGRLKQTCGSRSGGAGSSRGRGGGRASQRPSRMTRRSRNDALRGCGPAPPSPRCAG